MIPSTVGLINQDFETMEPSSKTYKMNEDNSVKGYTDKLDAVKQAVYKILNTERYKYIMYSWNYGVELEDLFGEPISYVCPELERRITEALTWDSRISGVSDFAFDLSKKGTVLVSFIVHTVYGDIQTGKAVSI